MVEAGEAINKRNASARLTPERTDADVRHQAHGGRGAGG